MTNRLDGPRGLPRSAAVVVLAAALLVFPLIAPQAIVNVGVFTVIYAIAAVGLTLLMGLAGQVSLGHAAFFAIGAYSQAILVTIWDVPALVAALASIGLAILSAALIGGVVLRLRGHYLALATLGLGVILTVVANESDLTGGPSGIAGVPKLEIMGHVFTSAAEYFWLSGAVLVVGLLIALNIVDSRIGRALSAVGDSETAAEVLGVDSFRLRHQVLVLSAAYAGVAGVLFAHWISVVTPSTASLSLSIQLLLMSVVGGLATVWGAVFGAVAVETLREVMRRFVPLLIPGAAGELELIGYGILILALILWLPGGLHQAWAWATRGRRVFGEPRRSHSVASEETGALLKRAGRPAPGTLLLQVRDAAKRFGGVQAVDGVTLEARAGEILALIGPNGAGKTTLFNLVSGVLPPTGGSVLLNGRRVDGRTPHHFARERATRTFQNLQIFGSTTVLGNVKVGRHLRSHVGLIGGALALPARSEERAIEETSRSLLALLGLGDVADAPAADLPFGRQRILELARALALEPDLLLLDEPLAGLSGAERWELARLLRRLRAGGMAIVIVEHDVEAVLALADRVAVLDNGKLLTVGDPATIRNDPATIAAYLGVDDDAGPRVAAPTDRLERSAMPGAPSLGPASTQLDVQGLRAAYGRLEVLHGVDLIVRSGELVAVLGANGAGKTSLLRAISGLIPVSEGTVMFRDKAISGWPPEAVAAAGIAHVPENRLVFPSLSVRDNLVLGAWTRRSQGGRATAESVERMLDLFPRLRERVDQPAGNLSGGEQQMLAIARGLMARPEALLLDEPSLGLAPRLVAEIFRALARLRDEERLAILLIEQNARAAFKIADRAYLLERGNVLVTGTTHELQSDERVQRAYLGGSYTDSTLSPDLSLSAGSGA